MAAKVKGVEIVRLGAKSVFIPGNIFQRRERCPVQMRPVEGGPRVQSVSSIYQMVGKKASSKKRMTEELSRPSVQKRLKHSEHVCRAEAERIWEEICKEVDSQ